MAEVRTRGGSGSSTMRARVMWSVGICCASAVNRRGARSRGSARREHEVRRSNSAVHQRGARGSGSTGREHEVRSRDGTVHKRGACSSSSTRRESEVYSSGSAVRERGACSSSSTRREGEVYSSGNAAHKRGACSSGSRRRGCEVSSSDSAVRKRGARSSDSVGRVCEVRAVVTASGVYAKCVAVARQCVSAVYERCTCDKRSRSVWRRSRATNGTWLCSVCEHVCAVHADSAGQRQCRTGGRVNRCRVCERVAQSTGG